jgi:hypothetical protein
MIDDWEKRCFFSLIWFNYEETHLRARAKIFLTKCEPISAQTLSFLAALAVIETIQRMKPLWKAQSL